MGGLWNASALLRIGAGASFAASRRVRGSAVHTFAHPMSARAAAAANPNAVKRLACDLPLTFDFVLLRCAL